MQTRDYEWFKARCAPRETGCWEWRGARFVTGYGAFQTSTDGKSVKCYAHRAMMEVLLGRSLGRHELVMHTCDNPPCINPAHLRVGTARDNARDAAKKGRFPYQRCMSEADVRAIRSAPGTQTEIAKRFGISQSAVSRIRRRQIWQHVD